MPRRSRFAYQPALDGVRAVAVAMVLVFHGGFGWMTGGYVGVSVFFTLSGFLITSLALVEHERTGRLDVRAFYARRVRRLMLASLLCLVGVIALAAAGVFAGVEHLRRRRSGSCAMGNDRLVAAGVPRVAWVVPPEPLVPRSGERGEPGDPARWATLRLVIEHARARRPDVVTVVDLAGWEARHPADGRCPDGLHYSVEAATAIAGDFLAPRLIAAALS